MANLVSEYFSQLKADEWRIKEGFSSDIDAANKELFKENLSDVDAIKTLNGWLRAYQPCLFGRLATHLGSISYCILNEADLRRTDELIKEKIQSARLAWKQECFFGKKSAFIIAVISPTLASALPSSAMQELARRLCFLYLQTDIQTNQIHTERISLGMPGQEIMWEWLAGVNYFCAQGDKRWWHDHRIPGGMAFSINSVGHLVKSGIISNSMKELTERLGIPDQGLPEGKIDSLEKALDFAMRTISMASNAVSGKATNLIPLSDKPEDFKGPKCPMQLSKPVANKNHCEYKGWYDTDCTLPAEYFLSDVQRPSNIKEHTLDFTYLFHGDIENPDFELAGKGMRTRSVEFKGGQKIEREKYAKRMKGEPRQVPVSSDPELFKALSERSIQ